MTLALLFFVAPLTLLFPSAAAVDVTVEGDAFTTLDRSHGAWGPIWTSTTTGYIVYLDDSEELVYRKTTNGGNTWGSTVPIRTNVIEKVAVWFDPWTTGDAGTKIHMAYLDSDNGRVRYRALDTNGDTLGTEQTVVDVGGISTTDDRTAVTIAKARGGNLYVGFFYDDGGTDHGFRRSTDGGTTWTARTSMADTSNAWIRAFPGNEASTNDVWVVYWDFANDALELKVHSDAGNSWSTTTISTGMADTTLGLQMSGAQRHSDNHLILAAWNGLAVATADLRTWDIGGAGSIVAKTDVVTDLASGAQAAVFIDQRTNDVYVGYLGTSGDVLGSTVSVNYKKSTDGGTTWGSEQNLDENAIDDHRWIEAGHSIGSRGGRFRPLWFNDDTNDILVASSASSVYLGPAVTLGLSGSPQAENGGVATVTATLAAAASLDVTVSLGYTGSATFGTDYSASSSSILITAGSTTGSVTITGVDDSMDEPDETVVVDITGVTNGIELTAQQVTSTITDDDPPPNVSLGLTGSPMAEAAGVATVSATLDAVSGLDVTVNLAFSGTAAFPGDYSRSGASILIPAGSPSASITLTAVQDSLDELDETIVVDISSVVNGVETGTQQVTATIADDDPAPGVSLGLTGSPMAEAAGVATVTATLDAVSGLDVTVDLGFTGSATLTSDYTVSGTSVLIPAGGLTGSIAITAVQDALDEPDETILVDVASVANGVETGTQQVTATIADDDPPTVTIVASDASAAEAGLDPGNFTVTRTTGDISGALTVFYTVPGASTATGGSDYAALPGNVTIPAGQASATILVTPIEDVAIEGNETVVVSLSADPAYVVGSPGSATVTIADNDAPASLRFGQVLLILPANATRNITVRGVNATGTVVDLPSGLCSWNLTVGGGAFVGGAPATSCTQPYQAGATLGIGFVLRVDVLGRSANLSIWIGREPTVTNASLPPDTTHNATGALPLINATRPVPLIYNPVSATSPANLSLIILDVEADTTSPSQVTVLYLTALPPGIPTPRQLMAIGSIMDISFATTGGVPIAPQSATIRFSISKGWIGTNCPPLHCAVNLFHYTSAGWEILGPVVLEENATHITYEVVSTSLSPFIIGGASLGGGGGPLPATAPPVLPPIRLPTLDIPTDYRPPVLPGGGRLIAHPIPESGAAAPASPEGWRWAIVLGAAVMVSGGVAAAIRYDLVPRSRVAARAVARRARLSAAHSWAALSQLAARARSRPVLERPGLEIAAPQMILRVPDRAALTQEALRLNQTLREFREARRRADVGLPEIREKALARARQLNHLMAQLHRSRRAGVAPLAPSSEAPAPPQPAGLPQAATEEALLVARVLNELRLARRQGHAEDPAKRREAVQQVLQLNQLLTALHAARAPRTIQDSAGPAETLMAQTASSGAESVEAPITIGHAPSTLRAAAKNEARRASQMLSRFVRGPRPPESGEPPSRDMALRQVQKFNALLGQLRALRGAGAVASPRSAAAPPAPPQPPGHAPEPPQFPDQGAERPGLEAGPSELAQQFAWLDQAVGRQESVPEGLGHAVAGPSVGKEKEGSS